MKRFFKEFSKRQSKFKDNDWRRLKAYAFETFALRTNMRNKEIRYCKVTDLGKNLKEIRACVSRERAPMGKPGAWLLGQRCAGYLKDILGCGARKYK